MTIYQLDFFEEDTTSEMRGQIEAIKNSQDRCRKSQFAKIGELKKMVVEVMERLEIIESNICRN